MLKKKKTGFAFFRIGRSFFVFFGGFKKKSRVGPNFRVGRVTPI